MCDLTLRAEFGATVPAGAPQRGAGVLSKVGGLHPSSQRTREIKRVDPSMIKTHFLLPNSDTPTFTLELRQNVPITVLLGLHNEGFTSPCHAPLILSDSMHGFLHGKL